MQLYVWPRDDSGDLTTASKATFSTACTELGATSPSRVYVPKHRARRCVHPRVTYATTAVS